MLKFLWIIILLAVLVYFIARRFFIASPTTTLVKATAKNGYKLIDTNGQLIGRVTKSTMSTVGLGILLFIGILLLGMKFKIIWIALPLSLYLIGQIFVYTNHVRATKDQRIYFDPENNEVLVDRLKTDALRFNLLRDVTKVTEVRSVQKNKGTLFGYYKLKVQGNVVVVPYLIEQNNTYYNKLFFERLNASFKIQLETKLFPIV